jgi:ankyrin repeat protein
VKATSNLREALLDGGAKINQTTEYGWTPLLTAINNRNYALASLLIDRGADVNLANKGGWTPLYIATDNRNIEGGDYPVPKPDLDHLEIIRKLLEKGANPNARIRDNTLTRTIFTMQWFFEDGATAVHPRGAVERHRAHEAAARVQGGSRR